MRWGSRNPLWAVSLAGLFVWMSGGLRALHEHGHSPDRSSHKCSHSHTHESEPEQPSPGHNHDEDRCAICHLICQSGKFIPTFDPPILLADSAGRASRPQVIEHSPEAALARDRAPRAPPQAA